jgi:hypothetical protein
LSWTRSTNNGRAVNINLIFTLKNQTNLQKRSTCPLSKISCLTLDDV